MNALEYDEYARLSEAGRPVPVFREVPGDLRTPVSAFLSLASRSERAFLLESVLGGERLARYSFLGREPVARLEVRGGRVHVHDAAGRHEEDGGVLDALRRRLGSASRGDPRAAALHGWRRRLSHLGRGAAVRAPARPPRRHRGHGRLVRLLRLARRLRPRAAAPGADRARRAGQPRGLRARPPGARLLSRRTSAGSAGRPRAARPSRRRRCRSRTARRSGRRCSPPRSTSPPATSSRSCSRASTPSTAAATRSPSTARCAWSTRRPTCSS